MSKTQNTIVAAALAGGWTLAPDGHGSSYRTHRFERRGRVVVVDFTKGGAVHSARIYTEGVDGKPPRNAEHVHYSFDHKAQDVIDWLDDGMPDAEPSQPATSTESDENAADDIAAPETPAEPFTARRGDDVVHVEAPGPDARDTAEAHGWTTSPLETPAEPAPLDLACAECGATDGASYVVTGTGSNRTEVCTSCHASITESAPSAPGFTAAGERVYASPAEVAAQAGWSADEYGDLSMRTDVYSSRVFKSGKVWVWSVRAVSLPNLAGFVTGDSATTITEARHAAEVAMVAHDGRIAAATAPKSPPSNTWTPNPDRLDSWHFDGDDFDAEIRPGAWGYRYMWTVRSIESGDLHSGHAHTMDNARQQADAYMLDAAAPSNPLDRGWTYRADVEVNDDEPSIATIAASQPERNTAHATVAVTANQDGSLAVLVVADPGAVVHVRAETDSSLTMVGGNVQADGSATPAITYAWF